MNSFYNIYFIYLFVFIYFIHFWNSSKVNFISLISNVNCVKYIFNSHLFFVFILFHGKSVHSWCDGSLDRSFTVDPLRYFSFQPVLHNSCNKRCGICYRVYGMMHVKEPLLLIGKSKPMWQQRVSSLYEWSFTICLMSFNRE